MKGKNFIEKISIFAILCVLSVGHLVHAELLIKPSIGFSQVNHTDDFTNQQNLIGYGGGASENYLLNPQPHSRSIIGNLGVYFQFEAGLFVGATYDMNFVSINNYVHVRTSGLGLTAGYIYNGWFGSATYMFFMSGSKELKQNSSEQINFPRGGGSYYNNFNLNMRNGMGALFQVGYIKFFGDMIGVGPSLQVRTFLFNETECVGGADIQCGSDRDLHYGYTNYLNQTYRTFDISLSLDIFFKI